MEAEKALKDLDEIKLIQKRFELITVARYRDKSRMKRAMEVQDKLREKSEGFKWDSTKELRKWRDSRYAVFVSLAKLIGAFLLLLIKSCMRKLKD